MIERKDDYEENPYFLPQILPMQEQLQRLRCPNNNQAHSACVEKECQIPGLICRQKQCSCAEIHENCHITLISKILKRVEKDKKQISPEVKKTYQAIYEAINQFIQKLSVWRTKFEKQEQYFGLKEEQLHFLELLYDKKIDQINGKLLNSLEKAFETQINLNKNYKEDIIRDFQQRKKEFDKLCKSIEQSYSQIYFPTEIIPKNPNFLKDSKILKKDQQKQMMNKWVSESFNNRQDLKSQLLFRASQHNFSKDQAHKKCYGKKNILVIIKNQFEKVIGGFTQQAWSLTQNNAYINDVNKKAFQFSINLKQKYKCLQPQWSLYSNSFYAFAFGTVQLSITDKCNQNKNSRCQLGHSYNLVINNANKYKFKDQQTNTLITGNPNGYYFKVIQYQVYQIKEE